MMPHVLFYSRQLKVLLGWSVIVRFLTGKHLPSLSEGSVYTRPTWLPSQRSCDEAIFGGT